MGTFLIYYCKISVLLILSRQPVRGKEEKHLMPL